jgi:hypothetical protein
LKHSVVNRTVSSREIIAWICYSAIICDQDVIG